MPFDILAVFSEFLFPVGESEFNHFDGRIPGAGPLATRLDLP